MKLLFVGDVMLGRLVNEVLKKEPAEYPWGDTLDIFKKADMRICNLECVITDVGQPWGVPSGVCPRTVTPKVFHFRTDEKNAAVLNTPPINIVSIANNHVLDFEYEGLNRMVKVLTDAKIVFAGAGSTLWDAATVGEYFMDGAKIGLIAFTDNEPGWGATEDRPGVFYVPIDSDDQRAKNLFELIGKTRDDVDILIVSAHWGPNWGYRPEPGHIPFAKMLIDAGADIIFGHSCHVFQGIEIYKGKPIFYSAGDFIDDYAIDEIERNDQSCIFLVETEGKRIARLKLYPTIVRNMQACLAAPLRCEASRQARKDQELELKDIVFKMIELCNEFNTRTTWQKGEKCLEIQI